MPAGHRQPYLVARAFGFEREADAVRLELQVLAHEIGTGTIESVADALVARHRLGEGTGLRIVEVDHRLARGVEEMGE